MLTLAPAELEEIGRLLTVDPLDPVWAWLDTHTGEVGMAMCLYGFEPGAGPADTAWDLDPNADVDDPPADTRLSDSQKAERDQVAAVCGDRTGRFVWIEVGGRRRLGVLHDFARTLSDDRLYEEVRAAMRGKGAFRRVKDVLHRHGKMELWHDFENRSMQDIAREWLEGAGVEWQERDGRAPGRAPG